MYVGAATRCPLGEWMANRNRRAWCGVRIVIRECKCLLVNLLRRLCSDQAKTGPGKEGAVFVIEAATVILKTITAGAAEAACGLAFLGALSAAISRVVVGLEGCLAPQGRPWLARGVSPW